MAKKRAASLHFPGYRVVRHLGSGGTGQVYLAEHTRSGLEVAIKVLGRAHVSNQTAARRFAREAELLSRINHPNVVTLYDFGQMRDGTPFQVLEYLRGEDLWALMARRERFAAEELGPFVQQICLGLHVAHEGGVVHRDLKPGNIWLLSTSPLQLKLIDFGAAKRICGPDITRKHHVVGTPQFIAPEVVFGQPLDRRVDIYSLGALLYWLISGRPPFVQGSPVRVLRAQVEDTPESLCTLCRGLLPEIAWLVHRCLEKDPRRRPATAKAVAQLYLDALRRAGRSGPEEGLEAAEAWTRGMEATTQRALESGCR